MVDSGDNMSVDPLRLKDRFAFSRLIGNTACVGLTNVTRFFGYKVYGKMETANPTGSHKDRESLEVLRDAIRKGYREVGCASTGNAAISLAALSHMSGLKCHIYLPRTILREKLALIRSFGPIVHVIRGHYGKAVRESEEEMERLGIYMANPGVCHPKIVGNSRIGQEISEAVKPDFVVCPTNNGTHVVGVWNGLRKCGCKPRIMAATARNTRIADSIGGFHRSEGPTFDQMLHDSGARIVNVTDKEIMVALSLLQRDGVIAEPAGAAGVAALHHLKAYGHPIVCCTITGSGLKFPSVLERVAHSH